MRESTSAYEVTQYCTWLTYGTPAIRPLRNTRRLAQIAFEARVLHLRNLARFLHDARPMKMHKRTDLVADHYFDGGWTTRPRAMHLYSSASSKRNNEVRNNVNVHPAHISTSRHKRRGTVDQFDWRQVEQDLVFKAFLKFLDDLAQVHPDRAPWFR